MAKPKPLPIPPLPIPPFPPFPTKEGGEPPKANAAEAALPVLKRVTKNDVRRIGHEITVTNTAEEQEYALYSPNTVNPASEWKKPEHGEVEFLGISETIQVVTKKYIASEPRPSMIVQADGISI